MTVLTGSAEDSAEMPVAYIRLYTDAEGHSRFEDVSPLGRTTGVVESDLRATFSEPMSADWVVFRHVVHEADDSRPHNAPRRQFIIMLKGECEVETSTGEKRRLGPGSVLLTEDTEGLGHITRRIGGGDRLTLLIPLGPEL
ncbi:hypothetical protein [Pseudonocardia sp. H11422]|uniref:hypothetical protein n=1 Tax=Pseudonocardia sp. H11422 TaxID=2835866 RepID=UPI001BDC0D79|nr:hypothetical protein [Pseudonocardia sp. H11422]